MPADTYAREGLRVKLERVPGITKKGVLDSPYYFQLPPKDEWSYEVSFSHTVYETVSAGQNVRPGGVELRRSSWSSLVVDSGTDDRGMPTPGFVILRDPIEIEEVTAELADICESGSPFLYTVAHQMPPGGYQNWSKTLAGPEAQWMANLLHLKVSELAGEGDARYFDLDFQEYKDPVVGRKALSSGGGLSSVAGFPAHVTLRADKFAYDSKTDRRIGTGQPATLAQIARHYYKDPSMASVIAKANGVRGAGSNDPLVGSWVHLTGKTTRKLTIPKPAVAHT